MAKDKEKEKKEQEEKEKEEGKKESWFQKVPPIYKVGGVALLFIRYMSIQQAKGNLAELWLWVIVVIAIWYFLGTGVKRIESTVLTPEEAEEKLESEIKRKIKNGQISRWAKYYIGPNSGIFHHEGMPQHYQIGVVIKEDNIKHYMRGVVHAEGLTKGYATIQDNLGKLSGREPIPIVSPLPPWLKRSKKHDLDLEKFLFGEKK